MWGLANGFGEVRQDSASDELIRYYSVTYLVEFIMNEAGRLCVEVGVYAIKQNKH